MMQTKSFKMKISDVDEGTGAGIFTGYASTFGNEDLIGEVFDRGAFKRSAKARGRGLPILLSHKTDQQIGVNLEMEEDEHGLMVKGELMIADIPKARETYAIIKRSAELGRSMGLSVGFIPKKDKWIDERLHYKEVELLEYSVTQFPMNPAASMVNVRDQSAMSSVHQIYQLTKRIREAGYEDDPAQRRLILQSIDELQALVASVNEDGDNPPDDTSDSGISHSLLANIREQLAGVGNYGSGD